MSKAFMGVYAAFITLMFIVCLYGTPANCAELVFSIGLGYDVEDDHTFEGRDFKGIIQIENREGDYSYGFWHSSQIDNGFRGDVEDQNVIYIKRDFRL